MSDLNLLEYEDGLSSLCVGHAAAHPSSLQSESACLNIGSLHFYVNCLT